MYFWNIKKLKTTLAKAQLSQKNSFRYLAYFFFFYSFILIVSFDVSPSYFPSIPIGLQIIIFLISNLLELFASYKFNGGKYGKDFLGRYLPIKLLTNLRLFVFYTLIMTLISIPLMWEYIDSDDILQAYFQQNPTEGIIFYYLVLILWRLIIPLRIIFHMRDIKSQEI